MPALNGAKGRPERGSPGFTLSELIIAVGLASIVFAGLGSMFSAVFRASAKALRQEIMQASETYVVKTMQRDFAQATIIWSPNTGASSSDGMEGFQNYAYTGGTPSYQQLDATQPIMRFVYRVCPADADSSYGELYRWRYTVDSLGGATKTCADKANGDPMVRYPIRLLNESGTDYFTRPNNNQILFQAILNRPETAASMALNVRVYTIFTAVVSGVRP